MPRDTDSIEREIENARNQLASTLDELTIRANPKRIAADARARIVAKLSEPKIKYSLIGTAAALVVLLLVRVVRR
ncbi:MAG TPA: DUF3618 domain-containing protein [Aldersonia sp.]